ncbi:sporulation protein YunB [Aquibacillus koreensis]|uniref:Sporulation protein YunB n=1 Tax=Aquibacillus koreensis TaxID=279446 RepID=A0A9X4AHW4_9BACI|nr:sporulation protein YunB [Aquibacillus koreensis]MCT2535915.1 sporulation protein YunB [Aquibacillus koreensis]MDC3420371.1 sporulation protein YunB [Aquibacillus koreensis]
MRKGPKFKRQITPPPARTIFVITFLFFVISTAVSILIVNEGIKPTLINIAQAKNEQYVNLAMGIAVNKKLNDELAEGELIKYTYDDNGTPVSYEIDASVQNRLQYSIHNRIENFLRELEKGNVPKSNEPFDINLEGEEDTSIEATKENTSLVEIPLGQVLGIPLLANFGPKVPVKLESMGYVSTEVETRVEKVGINNVHIESVVHIIVEIRTVIPFASKVAKIEQIIPIGSGGYKGEVPEFYNSGSSEGNTDFSIPIDPLQ